MTIQSLLRKPTSIDDIVIILELLDKPALVYNLDKGIIEASNSAFVRYTGYSKKDVIRKELTDILPDLELPFQSEKSIISNLSLANATTHKVKFDSQQLHSEPRYTIIRFEESNLSQEVDLPLNDTKNWEALDQLQVYSEQGFPAMVGSPAFPDQQKAGL